MELGVMLDQYFFPQKFLIKANKSGLGDLCMSKPTVIDLFSGCGGMSLGLEKAGYDIVYANDINGDALETYRHNFPHVFVEEGDITKIDPYNVSKKIRRNRVDVIVAGAPCQGFSTSGKRNPKDPRSKLFLQIMKFLKAFRPKIFVMENVSGLLSMEKGNTIKTIIEHFSNNGYHVTYKILSAAEFGVPQIRNRVFIVGSSKPIPDDKIFPKPTKKIISVKEAISDLAFLGLGDCSDSYVSKPESVYQKKMRGSSKTLHNHESANHSSRVQERFSQVPSGMDGRNVLKISDTNKRDYYRLHPNKTSRTITTLPEDLIHYKNNRIPTVRELARLQSFPDNFVFCGPRTTGGRQRVVACPQYTQIGNAVPPLLSEKLFRQLLKVLSAY